MLSPQISWFHLVAQYISDFGINNQIYTHHDPLVQGFRGYVLTGVQSLNAVIPNYIGNVIL